MIKKHGVFIHSVYKHYKGNYYRTLLIAYDCSCTQKKIVCYSKCDENGVYMRIEPKKDHYIDQPFYRELEEFKETVINDKAELVPRFEFIKHIR